MGVVSRRRLAAGIAIALAASVLLLMPGTSQSAGKNKVVKAKANKSFDPAKVTIKKGKKVSWKPEKEGGEDHSVSAYSGDWVIRQALYAGTNGFSLKFTKPGTYKYYCESFGSIVNGKCEGMCGVVKVKKPD